MTNKAFDTAANAASSREHFASRIGFILIAAGCAIGIGNVWRFPYITGEYGRRSNSCSCTCCSSIILRTTRYGYGIRSRTRQPKKRRESL